MLIVFTAILVTTSLLTLLTVTSHGDYFATAAERTAVFVYYLLVCVLLAVIGTIIAGISA